MINCALAVSLKVRYWISIPFFLKVQMTKAKIYWWEDQVALMTKPFALFKEIKTFLGKKSLVKNYGMSLGWLD